MPACLRAIDKNAPRWRLRKSRIQHPLLIKDAPAIRSAGQNAQALDDGADITWVRCLRSRCRRAQLTRAAHVPVNRVLHVRSWRDAAVYLLSFLPESASTDRRILGHIGERFRPRHFCPRMPMATWWKPPSSKRRPQGRTRPSRLKYGATAPPRPSDRAQALARRIALFSRHGRRLRGVGRRFAQAARGQFENIHAARTGCGIIRVFASPAAWRL